MSDAKLLELRGLCVSYGPVEAVHQVDLDVRADARMLLRQVLEAARDDAHHLGPLAFDQGLANENLPRLHRVHLAV